MTELILFQRHCENEFYRIAATYRANLRFETLRQLNYWKIHGKVVDMILLKKALKEYIQPERMRKFEAKNITREEMAAAFSEMKKPNYDEILSDEYAYVDRVFQI